MDNISFKRQIIPSWTLEDEILKEIQIQQGDIDTRITLLRGI